MNQNQKLQLWERAPSLCLWLPWRLAQHQTGYTNKHWGRLDSQEELTQSLRPLVTYDSHLTSLDLDACINWVERWYCLFIGFCRACGMTCSVEICHLWTMKPSVPTCPVYREELHRLSDNHSSSVPRLPLLSTLKFIFISDRSFFFFRQRWLWIIFIFPNVLTTGLNKITKKQYKQAWRCFHPHNKN